MNSITFVTLVALDMAQFPYLRYDNDHDKVHCFFLMAKQELHRTTRLERTAAVTSLSVMLKSAPQMKISEELFWTDSRVVLAYINNESRRFHLFVANRVQFIRECTAPGQWHYVDTKENLADCSSRGSLCRRYSVNELAFGSKFSLEV